MLLARLYEIGLVDLVLIFFTVYRLSVMFHHDDELGPDQILYRIKIKLGVQESSNGDLYGYPGTWQEAILCYYCNSPWIGLASTLVFAALVIVGWHSIARILFIPFAASGFTVLLAKYTG
jgi:hypothetical protein